ncbi:MAG: YciI family protein [Oxalobacteraceae bacterium]
MFFLVLATDAPGMASVRKEVRPVHRAYLRNPNNHQIKVHLGGPTLTTQGEDMNGTLLVVEANDIAAVSEFVADDPYSQAGVFKSVEIRPWAWTLGAPVMPEVAEATR